MAKPRHDLESSAKTPVNDTSSLPPTSLIVCSRNRPAMLEAVVKSILEGEEVPTELIMIDDSDSVNESLACLVTERPCQIRYLWNRSRGLSRANNRGMALARYEVLVFTQDDMLVARRWFGTIVRSLQVAGRRTVVTGRVLPGAPESDSAFAPSTIAEEEPRVFQGRLARDVLYFQNVAFYRSVLHDTGGFDPNLGPGTPFPSAEDNEFAFRLLDTGYRILYDPRAVVYHRAWRTQKESWEVEWNYGRGQGAFYAKYFRVRDPFTAKRLVTDTASHLIRLPIKAVFYRQQLRGSLAFLAGMISGATEWVVRRPDRRLVRNRQDEKYAVEERERGF
jgi:GT2 family glycosyltransferase